MTAKDADELLAMFAAGPGSPAREFLGGTVEAVDQERGRGRIVFAPGPELCAHGDLIHGGFLSAMLDEAMSVAGVIHSGLTQVVPTLAMNVSYLHPVRRGRLVAEGEVVRRGRRVGFLAGRLHDSDGRLCATATATVRVLPMRWAHPERDGEK